jgi:outer membrane protein OmpA-like peptidoglycan-associated protein
MQRISTFLGMVLLAVASGAALAQAVPILKGSDVNESNLVNALKPEPRLRSLKVEPRIPPKPAAASLLITFRTDSADLTPEARSQLDVVGRALKTNDLVELQFEIEGYADPRGGHEYNQRLSASRALAVREYLIVAHNIRPERLHAVGKGDWDLLNPENPTAPENRRVTIKTLTQ